MQKILSKSALAFAFASFLSSGYGAAVPLVEHGSQWFFHKGTNAPQGDWKTAAETELNAEVWATGLGGFGYANNNGVTSETNNCGTMLTDMYNGYTTVYMRRQFTVTDNVDTNLHLYLRMDFDDGFIAWLDGVYLTNRYVSGAPTEPANTAAANTDHESSLGNNGPKPVEVFDLGDAAAWLGNGTHTLAIIGLNNGVGSSDFVQVADLYLDAPPPPPTSTAIVNHGDVCITRALMLPKAIGKLWLTAG